MLTFIPSKDEIERRRRIFSSDIGSELKRLDIQRKRILDFSPLTDSYQASPNHDADFYMVILRRLYRRIEAAQHDPRVANLKGRYIFLFKKIKIRDHFEHEIDYNNFPQYAPGIIIVGGIVLNSTNPHIVSGDQEWLLNDDHKSIKELMTELATLYPFAPKPERQSSLLCRIIQQASKRFRHK